MPLNRWVAVERGERTGHRLSLVLIDLDDFVRLYTDVYDRVDEETRALLPLVRIWWPA